MSEKPSWTKWVPEAVASTARARVLTSSRTPQRRPAMTISSTRVYARLGDKGETALVGGKRVPKDSPRIVAYGTIDELNAIVGIVRTFNEERLGEGEHHRWLDEVLRRIQNELFDLGSELATPPEAEYEGDRKSTRLNSSHSQISYAVFCLKKKKITADMPSVPLSPTWCMLKGPHFPARVNRPYSPMKTNFPIFRHLWALMDFRPANPSPRA